MFHQAIAVGPEGELVGGRAVTSVTTSDLVRDRLTDPLEPARRPSRATARGVAQPAAAPRPSRRGSASRSRSPPIPATPSPTTRPRAWPAGSSRSGPRRSGWPRRDDPELVEEFADIARQEYLAVGIRVALHPQVDLATEPRWARQSRTFGEDAELASRLVAAYVRGFQGAELGPDSVACMTKHFPGGGPQKDGEDPHFPYGREQVYPGGSFDYHLSRSGRARRRHAQIMPYYGMPVGTRRCEEVGFGFNKGIITGLLREQLGFDGIVCTDWGLVTDAEICGSRARPVPGASST